MWHLARLLKNAKNEIILIQKLEKKALHFKSFLDEKKLFKINRKRLQKTDGDLLIVSGKKAL